MSRGEFPGADYDRWKTTDDTPEPEPPDMCPDCEGVGECGCDRGEFEEAL